MKAATRGVFELKTKIQYDQRVSSKCKCLCDT